MMLERDVERRLVARLKKAGISHVKMTAIGRRGFPDRLILLPGSRVLWIELKAPGRENNLSAGQEAVIELLSSLGHRILVSSDPDQCMEWINANLETA